MGANEASNPAAVHSLILEFTDLARQVHASEDFSDSLARITATAEQAIGGCEAASISLLTRDGPITFGATNALADEGDQIQYEEGEGPCLDAAMDEQWVYTPDLAVDPRWPRSAARLSLHLGVHSMFSTRLTLDAAPNDTLGGLNMYATRPDAFSQQDQMLALLLSSLGAVVVDAARQQENLRRAIESRQVIGEAVGILRAQNQVSSEQAFRMLSQASQRMNVKLRDVAERIVRPPEAAAPPNGGSQAAPE
jgi:transcriptional regulator with GAF, ATPase, and Fis domain